jgi:hypothetical protein
MVTGGKDGTASRARGTLSQDAGMDLHCTGGERRIRDWAAVEHRRGEPQDGRYLYFLEARDHARNDREYIR